MSLDDFLGGKKKPSSDAGKKFPSKPATKKPTQKKTPTTSRQRLDDDDEILAGTAQDGVERGSSVLRGAGLLTFKLECTKCKFKKEVRIPADPKPHHLTCKKCGGSMKVVGKA